MSKMSRKQFLRWEKLRMRGERSYILKSTIVYGIILFVALNAVSWAWMGTALGREFIILYPVLGSILGMAGWSLNESRFEAFLSNKLNAASSGKR